MARELAPFANRDLLPLSDKDLERICPAVFAEAPRDDVSEKYGFVSTAKLVAAMRKEGFVPTQANAYYRRDADKRQFTKHMVRFRKDGDFKRTKVGDSVHQVCLVNSHDRSSQFQLFGGLWRLICGNGLMVAEGPKIQPIVVRHTTSAVDGLLDATGELIKQQKFVVEHVESMREMMLTEKQKFLFADAALHIRPERAGTIDPKQLLSVRRPEDEGDDLWRVFNRVQENMMRGGQQGVTANQRAVVTRGVTSVNADLHLNTHLWALAMETIAKAAASSARTTRKAKPAPAAEAAPSEAPAA